MDGDIQIMKFIHNVRVLNPRDATELCGAVMCPDHDPDIILRDYETLRLLA
jgi:hypothetical protein